MNKYELIMILKPKTKNLDELIQNIKNNIIGADTVYDEKNYGERQLVYSIKRCTKGIYYAIKFERNDSVEIIEIEQKIRVIDDILKFITVRVEE